MKTYKGRYTPINEEKYIGDINGIVYRSSWEAKFAKFVDLNSNVAKWSSEELIIQYFYSLDGKMHRYFPDFYVEFTNGRKVVIEIKPYAQTQEPILKKNGNKRVFGDQMATYLKNIEKWKAAKVYCESRGWEFSVFTERELARLK